MSAAGVTVTAIRPVSADRRLCRGQLATSRLADATCQKQRRASGARWEPPTSDRMTHQPADTASVERILAENAVEAALGEGGLFSSGAYHHEV